MVMAVTRYEGVLGREAFGLALTRAEEMDSDVIWQYAVDIPEERYGRAV